MPRSRRPENKGLPNRWRKKPSGYYYQVPKGQESKWDGKQTYKLGNSLPEAYKEWARKLEYIGDAKTVGDLLDRYANEILPTKAAASHKRDALSLRNIRSVFGDMDMNDIKPRHIYAYIDKRKSSIKGKTGITAARLETALLSHAYTKAVEWGYIDKHPFKGEIRVEAAPARTRYVEDSEVAAALSLPSPQKKGGVKVIQAYIRIKLLTALRQRDMLNLKTSQLKEDGIHLTVSKTGRPIIIQWTETLRKEIDAALALRPVDISPYVFCTREGKCFVNAETGLATGWHSMWQRFMNRLIEEKKISDRFTEHDLRAKCASDSETLERAQELLTHSDSATTKRVYRRKPDVIVPMK